MTCTEWTLMMGCRTALACTSWGRRHDLPTHRLTRLPFPVSAIPLTSIPPIFFIGCSWIRCNGRIWQLTLREHWTLNKEFMVTLGADNHQYTYPDEIMYAAGITHLSCAWHIPNLGTRTPFDYQASLLDIFRDKFGAKPVANNWPDGRRIDWDTWVRDKMGGAYPP